MTQTQLLFILILLSLILLVTWFYVGAGVIRLMKKKGGYTVSKTNGRNPDPIRQKVDISRSHHFTAHELLELGNPANQDGQTVAHHMSNSGHFFTFEQLMQLGNPADERGGTPAHWMAGNGYKFSIDQILALGDAPDKERIGISQIMVQKGHPFSFDEILRLKNPADRFGVTLAHWMARYGHRFTVDEILGLGNPVIAYSKDDLEEYIPGGWSFPIDEESSYRSKEYVLHNGATIAHIMSREGHRFTVEEIITLGNPKDAKGLTIADWMAIAGNPLSAEDMQRLMS